jgi:hypothetical protein
LRPRRRPPLLPRSFRFRRVQFQLAVFGKNGPISAARPNTIWFREKIEFFRRPDRASPALILG